MPRKLNTYLFKDNDDRDFIVLLSDDHTMIVRPSLVNPEKAAIDIITGDKRVTYETNNNVLEVDAVLREAALHA